MAIGVRNQGGIVEVEWVQGHAGNMGNETADESVNAAYGGHWWDLAQGGLGEIRWQGFMRQTRAEEDLHQVLKLQIPSRNY